MKKRRITHSCDKVQIKTKEQIFQGLLMPGSDSKKAILKLKSGYNIGIEKKKILSQKVIAPSGKDAKACATSLDKPVPIRTLKHRKGLKTICLLHTGGTISSKINYETGGVSAAFTPEEIVSMFPELEAIANIDSRLISNMFSEDMRFAHYNTIAKEIAKEIKKGVDGIIVTHGTDTMGYSAAALSFILEDLPIPVLLAGSQRSSDRGSSDAALNLLCAAHFIVKSDFGDVGICMHSGSSDDKCAILPATKTRKMHTSRRDTFKAVNTEPYAEITKQGIIHYLNNHYAKQDKKRKLQLKLFKENVKVGSLPMHPNFYAKELEAYKSFDGLILQGTGLGHMPINVLDAATKEHQKIYKTLQQLAKKMPVVMTPQPLFGRVNMNVYATGVKLKEAGVLGDYCDMLPETAFIKVAWLLSNYPKGQVKELVGENLRGEITKRSLQHEFPE